MVRARLVSGVLLGILACPVHAFADGAKVPVSVHGVNYSNQEFSYIVEDPANAKNKAGGETIDRFGAGGTMCCYELPKQWKPGLQVKVNSTHWLPEQPDGKLPEVKQSFVVEVPPYVDGTPGELWVLRQADGGVKVVSSDYQPDHEKWPGEVKGWPVPSLEYRRERVQLYLRLAEGKVKVFTSLLKALEMEPERAASEAWETSHKYNPRELEGFSGPEDPKYKGWLKTDYLQSLAESVSKVTEYRQALRGVADSIDLKSRTGSDAANHVGTSGGQ